MMKAITAAVIAILNVNIGFHPLAHFSAGTKRYRGPALKQCFSVLLRRPVHMCLSKLREMSRFRRKLHGSRDRVGDDRFPRT
jgi:hypothetical protein